MNLLKIIYMGEQAEYNWILFRHIAATVVAKNCKNEDELKEFTRHKSNKGLEPYKHLIEEEDKKQIQEKATAFFND